MSKAMLIMDMPKNCSNCPCLDTLDYICKVEYKHLVRIDVIGKDERPSWCPLREVPQKKESAPPISNYEVMKNLHAEGYNACIDEILGGGE